MMLNKSFSTFVDALTRRSFVFRYAGILFFVSMLTACAYPVAKDDFSVLGSDIFSNMIRNAYSEVYLTGDTKGVSRLNKSKLKTLSAEVLLNKNRKILIQLFSENDGKCKSSVPRGKLYCEVIRRWRVINIGGKTDTNGWVKPSVRIEFVFYFEENENVQNFDLTLIDTSTYDK